MGTKLRIAGEPVPEDAALAGLPFAVEALGFEQRNSQTASSRGGFWTWRLRQAKRRLKMVPPDGNPWPQDGDSGLGRNASWTLQVHPPRPGACVE